MAFLVCLALTLAEQSTVLRCVNASQGFSMLENFNAGHVHLNVKSAQPMPQHAPSAMTHKIGSWLIICAYVGKDSSTKWVPPIRHVPLAIILVRDASQLTSVLLVII